MARAHPWWGMACQDVRAMGRRAAPYPQSIHRDLTLCMHGHGPVCAAPHQGHTKGHHRRMAHGALVLPVLAALPIGPAQRPHAAPRVRRGFIVACSDYASRSLPYGGGRARVALHGCTHFRGTVGNVVCGVVVRVGSGCFRHAPRSMHRKVTQNAAQAFRLNGRQSGIGHGSRRPRGTSCKRQGGSQNGQRAARHFPATMA